jgi:hypothetical protein
LTGELLDLKYAALAAQPSQTETVRAAIGQKRYREIIRIERFAAFAAQTTAVSPDAS